MLAVLLVPSALAWAYVPGSVTAVTAIVLLLILTMCVDGLRAYGSLDSVRAFVPEITRMIRGTESSIELTLEQPVAMHQVLQIGLALPEAFRSSQHTLFIRMPSDAPKALVEWLCVPSRRGNYPLDRVYIAVNSPWGLWEHRRAIELNGTLRVYPNVQQERKNLAAIFLNRDPLGIHARRFVGKGREFEQLREYVPGDSFEDIHWKATARRGQPITKIFQVERTQEVYVAIDSSRLSGMSPGNGNAGSSSTILERYIDASLVLGLVAEKQGDLFGLITFDQRVNHFLKARRGRGHFNACRDAIYAVEPSEHNPDFAELFSFIRLNLRKRALLVILTNLSDPLLAESFTENINLIARNHLILVNAIADPEVQPVFSDARVQTIDDIYTRIGGHFEWSNLQRTRQTLHLQNVAMQFLPSETLSADIVSQYISRKQRQLL